MSESLSIRETIRRKTLEKTIDKNLKAFSKVGVALLKIRDGRLYRDKYSSFEEYCKERWGFTRVRAHQLISASIITENIESTDQVIKPANEAQIRPLIKLEPSQQIEAWNMVVETAPKGNVTGKHVDKVVSEIKGQHEDESSHDDEEVSYEDQQEIVEVENESVCIDVESNSDDESRADEPLHPYQNILDIMQEFDEAINKFLMVIVKARKDDWNIISKDLLFQTIRLFVKTIVREKRFKQEGRAPVDIKTLTIEN